MHVRVFGLGCLAALLAGALPAGSSAEAQYYPTFRTTPPPEADAPNEPPTLPGAAQTYQYRRMRDSYANDPGAQMELDRNRIQFCENQPNRC